MTKDEIINKARGPEGYWTIDSLAAAIGKPANHDRDGNTTLNGTYSIDELEAILSSAYMERASCGMSG